MATIAAMVAVIAVSATEAPGASATTMRTGGTSGPAYSGGFAATSVGAVVLPTSSGVGTITCTGASLGGSMTGTGSASVTSAVWSGCTNNLGQSCTVTGQNLPWSGAFSFVSLSSQPNATFTVTSSPYAGVGWVCGSTTCFYGAAALTLNFDNPNGGTGSQLVGNLAWSKQAGSTFACSSSATWTVTYDIVTDPGAAWLYATA